MFSPLAPHRPSSFRLRAKPLSATEAATAREVDGTFPFELLGFDTDNGFEFLNWHLLRYVQERSKAVGVTRSRPYKKDDNCYVEQNKCKHVR